MERTKTHESQYASRLIEASLDPLVTISTEGKITDMNQALANITSMSIEQLKGTNLFDYFTEPQKAHELCQEIFTNGSVADLPLTLQHKDGKLTDVLFNGSVCKDDIGNILGIVVLAKDFTDKKRAIELRSANKEFAFQNKDRETRASSLDKKIQILHLEDSIKDSKLIHSMIESEGIRHEYFLANNEKDYLTILEKENIDLILSDFSLPDYNGNEAYKIASEKYSSIPFIFVSGVMGEDAAINAMLKGVTDYVLKDKLERLIPAIKRALYEYEIEIKHKNVEINIIEKNKEIEAQKEKYFQINDELIYQNKEKEKRAAELIMANKELAFQNVEKEKKAAKLILANKELVIQNREKEKRADELLVASKELAFQNKEKEKRAAELIIANKELAFQNKEKEKRAAELIVANKELIFQNTEKEKRAAELSIANKELAFQNKEKEKRAAELRIANKELLYQNVEKEKRATELSIANKELAFQNNEKEKRAAELIIANKELAFQNKEKEKRAAELRIANYARSIIEASLDPLFTVNLEGKITDMNNASINIIGKSRKKLIGSDFFKYFTEPQKAREVYKEVFAKGFVTDYPLTIRDGILTDVLCNGSVYKDDRGDVLGVVMVARDITEQKRIETELIEAKVFAELATLIAEEAKGKAESAAKIAESAVKAKQQFLSNMSHEIRTPMNAIIGFTKVVLKTELSAKQKEYLLAIKMSGDALIVLINDILDLAKVDAGKMTFEQTPFKMALSISAMLHLFETKIQEKNLKLVKEFDKEIPDVLIGDPVRLHQIILNLVSNAVKFTNKGKITVSVRLLNEDEEKVDIEFAVTDTGIGIADDKIGKIFENFQQASSGTARLFGGTGLGLAIVKQLVETQGGKINVKSNIDVGSTFSFTLSFLKTNAQAELDAGIEETDVEVKDIKVLVVEDIALNQLLMKTLLDDFGFDGDIAANGRIAIEKLQTKNYDIILMDLQMPEMNGFEATEYIRNKMNSNVPIIALTADVTTVDLAKCKDVGMNDYISKPVDERLLYSKIIALVKKPLLVTYNESIEVGNGECQKVRCTDLDYLNHRTKSNPKLMMQMISLYLEQTPILISKMNQGLMDKDWDSLHAAAHKMIPSFAIMGISADFENMARKVQEYAGAQKQISGIQDMVFQLENVCNQACEELKEEYNRINSSNP